MVEANERAESGEAAGAGEGSEGKVVVRKAAVRGRRSPVKVAPSKDEDAASRAAVVKKLLKNMEQKLSGKDAKASLGDYIRLVQLQKELDDDAPREIKVRWVETGTETTGEANPDTTSGSGE